MTVTITTPDTGYSSFGSSTSFSEVLEAALAWGGGEALVSATSSRVVFEIESFITPTTLQYEVNGVGLSVKTSPDGSFAVTSGTITEIQQGQVIDGAFVEHMTIEGLSINVGQYISDFYTYYETGNGVEKLQILTDQDVVWIGGDRSEVFGTSEVDFFDTPVNLTGNLLFRLGAGNDTAYGSSGMDTLIGASGNDKLFGGLNDDVLSGGSGEDLLSGKEGNDILRGGTKSDDLFGGDGNDRMLGGGGADSLYGGNGDDSLSGQGGDDRISGFKGANEMSGGKGSDRIFGGYDWDTISGDQGGDTISGSDGNDSIWGGGGNDILEGGNGDDDLFGGRNSDTIYGGTGLDRLTGGTGADVFVFADDLGDPDTILDFQTRIDVIDLVDPSSAEGVALDEGLLITSTGAQDILVVGVFDFEAISFI